MDPQVTCSPHMGRRLLDGWKRVSRKIGDVQARVLLTFVYFGVITPFALAVRLATDPLALKPATPKGWRPRAVPVGPTLEWARQQF